MRGPYVPRCGPALTVMLLMPEEEQVPGGMSPPGSSQHRRCDLQLDLRLILPRVMLRVFSAVLRVR